MSTIFSCRRIENKNDICRDSNWMWKSVVNSWERACIENNQLKRKKWSSISHMEMQKSIKKNLTTNIWKIKNIVKLEITVIVQGNIEVLHKTYVI